MIDKDSPLAFLADQAYEVASRYQNPVLAPEHLLYAVCCDEQGRDSIESLYEGDVSRILSFLTRSFKDRKDESQTPRMGDEIHKFIAALIGLNDQEEETVEIDPLSVPEIFDIMVSRCAEFPVVGAALDFGNVVSFGDDLPLDEDIDEDAVERAFEGELTGAVQPDIIHQQASSDPNAAAMLASLRNLSELARQGQLSPVVGRDELIKTVAEALTRHRKPNVLLVGEAGVGKSAVVEGLAQRLLSEAPRMLVGRPLIEVSMTSMMAGTRYRGDFEARMRHLIEFAIRRKAILFIDEGHALVGSGTGSSGGMDATTILKPALARGELSVISATTPHEARAIMKDRALSRRFQLKRVLEPSSEDMHSILDQARVGYEQHHGVELVPEAAREIVSLAEQYMPGSRFPDKAFDVLDLSALAARRVSSQTIEVSHVRGAICELTGVSIGRPDAETLRMADMLEPMLNKAVLGQAHALRELSRAVRLSLLGLNLNPVIGSSHLFTGPTGVGKTEAAKTLSNVLGVPFVRLDMSEYMEKHAVSKLIGAPPGYVGYHDEGTLIEAANTHPRMVLLLDEVEKAHPDVFDILLQVLDAGRLTSSDGRIVSFRGVHIILTSNLGAREADAPGMGFGARAGGDEAVREVVSKHFRPEFIERLSSVVNFNKITKEIARSIIDKELARVAAGFVHKDMSVTICDGVCDIVLAQLPDGALSGRRVWRTIERLIADVIGREMIGHPEASGFAISAVADEICVKALFEELDA